MTESVATVLSGATPTVRDAPGRAPPRGPTRLERRQTGVEELRRYRGPSLRRLGTAADLLEILGPAQASYGGPGLL